MRTISQISMDAWFTRVQPSLTRRENWVLEAIEILGEASAETVAEHYGVGVNVISGRFTGLKKKGLIYPTERKRTRTGAMCQFYSAYMPQEAVFENE
jgi:hypothetical protein